MGRKSERVARLEVLGTGVMTAVRHWLGTVPVLRLQLKYE